MLLPAALTRWRCVAWFSSALFLVSLLLSCTPLQQSTPIKGTVIPIAPVATYANAANDAFPVETMVVIREQATWQSAWNQVTHNMFPQPNLPQVDFSTRIVLVAAAGTKPTGGYSVGLLQAVEDNGAISVDVTSTSPGTGCVVTQLVTSPVDIGSIPQTTAPIMFNVTRKVQGC